MNNSSHKGGSATNDDEINLESDNFFKFLKNHSNLFSKIKKFEKIIIDLKKKVCEKDKEIHIQKSYFLNKIDQINSQLIDSQIIRKDLEIQIDILKDEFKECEKLPKEGDEPKEETCTNAFQHSCMKKFCHECQDFGHIASECTNTLEKAKNKWLNVTWDDSDKMNFTSFVTTFKDNCENFDNNSDFEFTDDELTFDYDGNSELSYEEKFRDLLKDYVLKRKENSNLSYKINDLEKEIKSLKRSLGESEKNLEIQKINFEENLNNSQSKYLSSEKNLELQKIEFLEKLKVSQCKFLSCEKARKELEEKISVLMSELENYKNISKQFTIGSQGLDKLLNIGKSFNDRSGLGFDKASNVPSTSQTTFVRPTSKVESSNSQGKASPKGQNFQNPRPSVHESNKNKCASSRTTSKKFIPICHHCGVVGHIRPKCFKLLNDQSYVQLSVSNRFHVSNEKFVSKNSNFQKASTNMFEKEKVRDSSHRPLRQKFIPKCHHCGVMGHIRPKCQKILREKSSFEINLFKKFDEIVNKISKLRNGMDRRPIVDAIDAKRNPEKKIWVKKGVIKGNSINDGSPRVFDISKINILKRPSESNKLN